MRTMMVFMCAVAVAACASSQKPATKAERPAVRTVVAEVGERRAEFEAGGVWVPLPQDGGSVTVLQHAEVRGSAIALFFSEAAPNSTVEEATVRYAMMMLSGAMVFQVKAMSDPVYASDEESSFTLTGVDGETPMTAKCLIRHLGDRNGDYWVLILSVSPEAMRDSAFSEVDRIAKTLRLQPLNPP